MAQVQTPNPAEAYENYLVRFLFEPWTAELLRRAVPQPGERVLDIACGTGIVARRAAPLVGPTGTVVGLDVSPGMLEVARARAVAEGLAIAWREGSAIELPLAAGSFDLVTCQQGLQFFPDRMQAVREMRRVLADGGRAAIGVWLWARGPGGGVPGPERGRRAPLGYPDRRALLAGRRGRAA